MFYHINFYYTFPKFILRGMKFIAFPFNEKLLHFGIIVFVLFTCNNKNVFLLVDLIIPFMICFFTYIMLSFGNFFLQEPPGVMKGILLFIATRIICSTWYIRLTQVCIKLFFPSYREVEDFARRLNSVWPERMQELLSLGQERRLAPLSINGNGSTHRYTSTFLLKLFNAFSFRFHCNLLLLLVKSRDVFNFLHCSAFTHHNFQWTCLSWFYVFVPIILMDIMCLICQILNK